MAMVRRSDLLKKVFRQYLIPMIVLSVASSLSEFVDSIIVSALLGNDALAIVNLGMPVTLVFVMVALLVSIGGSNQYAKLVGEHKPDEAQATYSVSIYVLVGAGLVIMTAGYAFSSPIAAAMSADSALLASLDPYVHVLFLAAIPYIFVTGYTYFLTAAGHPNMAMTITIIANVVNVVMDLVFISVFHMGVVGAAVATLTGYLIAMLFTIVLGRTGFTDLKISRVGRKDFRLVPAICAGGIAVALGQLGFVCKFSFMNWTAGAWGGTAGIIVFSLCIQTLSITSLFLSGITECTMPIISTLRGERDQRGIRIVMRYAMWFLLVFVVLVVAFFELAPMTITTIYSIQGAELNALAWHGIREFSIVHLIRTFAVLLMYYFTAVGRRGLSIGISMIDSFAVIPVCYLMCLAIGLDGVWLSFPVTGVICLVFIWVATRVLNRRSAGKTEGVFMYETVTDAPTLDLTVRGSAHDAVSLSSETIDFAKRQGCTSRLANLMGLLAEEMTDYITQNASKKTNIDVLVKVYDSEVCLYFRSDGAPLSALKALGDGAGETAGEAAGEKDAAAAAAGEKTAAAGEAGVGEKGVAAGEAGVGEKVATTTAVAGESATLDDQVATTSEQVLRRVALELNYERVLGMNSTKLVLAR